MNDNARKWVQALRSGEYKQGKDYLHKDGRYCCLGVACELAVKDGLPVTRHEYDSGAVSYDNTIGILPEAVREWLGLNYESGYYIARNGHETSLATRNDAGVSFSKIADLIESEPKELFA